MCRIELSGWIWYQYIEWTVTPPSFSMLERWSVFLIVRYNANLIKCGLIGIINLLLRRSRNNLVVAVDSGIRIAGKGAKYG